MFLLGFLITEFFLNKMMFWAEGIRIRGEFETFFPS